MASFDKLFHKQTQMINSIHRALPNFKKLGQAKMTIAVTQNRIGLVQGHYAIVQDLDAKLHSVAEEKLRTTHPYFVEEQFIACESAYGETLDYMHEVLSAAAPSGSVVSPTGHSDSKVSSRSASHLPRLELPTFNGSFSQWETFRDRFKSMIIQNQSLSNVERMHYLCSVLSGDASKTISHLAVTEANFMIAWETVSSCYENTRRLINLHLQTLFSLPPVQNETAKNLQALRDQTNGSIQALKNLGRSVNMWDDILVYLVAQKLDKSSRKAWELKLGDIVDFPAYSDIDTFIESRIRALEAILPARSSGMNEFTTDKTAKNKSVAAHSTTTTKFACPICKKGHLLYQCMTFLAYHPARRHEFIKAHKRCFNCLALNHATRDCRSERRCRECARKHHTLLHASTDVDPASDETSSTNTGTKASSDKAPADSEVASHAISRVVSTKTAVLLATARVRVHSSSGRVARVRALLDQGSAATLISENLAQVLRLPRVRRVTRVIGIGESMSYARHVADIRVSPASKDDPAYATTAIILRSLTKCVPNRVSRNYNWSHISDLLLADHDPMNADPLDIIIGADLYGLLIRDGVRRGNRDEPIAQNTTLGWILSGPISLSDDHASVHTHHWAIVENLDLDLRRFWEVEEIPQQACLSPEEQQCEDHFLQTHARNPDGRYIVRLPFKNGRPADIGDSRVAALASL